MPATSKAQQALFGIAHAIQTGKRSTKGVSDPAKKIAKNVSKKDVKDFASTPTKGLPKRKPKKENKLVSFIRNEVKSALKEGMDWPYFNLKDGFLFDESGDKIEGTPKFKDSGEAEDWLENNNVRGSVKEGIPPSLSEIVKELPPEKKHQLAVAYKVLKMPAGKVVKDGMNTAQATEVIKQITGHDYTPKKMDEKKEMNVFDKHQLAIAYKTMNMPDAMVGVMGGPNKEESKAIIKRITGKDYKERKEGIEASRRSDIINKARATADPKQAYGQYTLHMKKAGKPVMPFDQWEPYWKGKQDESKSWQEKELSNVKVMKCRNCGADTPKNNSGLCTTCQDKEGLNEGVDYYDLKVGKQVQTDQGPGTITHVNTGSLSGAVEVKLDSGKTIVVQGRKLKEEEQVCGCGHSMGKHNQQTGQCSWCDCKTPKPMREGLGKYTCANCGADFKNMPEYVKHVNKCNSEELSELSMSPTDIAVYKPKVGNEWKCKTCGAVAGHNAQEALTHLEEKHHVKHPKIGKGGAIVGEGNEKFQCPKCGKSMGMNKTTGQHSCSCGYKEKEPEWEGKLHEATSMTADKLMQIDNKVFQKLGVQSGGEIRDSKSKWAQYVKMLGMILKGIAPVSQDTLLKLENENYHNIMQALGQLGLVDPRAPYYKSLTKTPMTKFESKNANVLREIVVEIVKEETEAGRKAKQLGLDYMGFGRYGKKGKQTHAIENGKLVSFAGGKQDKSDKKYTDFAAQHSGEIVAQKKKDEKEKEPKYPGNPIPQYGKEKNTKGTTPKRKGYTPGKESDDKALNFWRDAFLKHNAKMSAAQVKTMRQMHPGLNLAFSDLASKESFGGAYIKKLPNGDYVWPEMTHELGGTEKNTWDEGKLNELGTGVVSQIRNGDRVTIKTRFGKEITGKARIFNREQNLWVLNMGGTNGTPGLADEKNIVSINGKKV